MMYSFHMVWWLGFLVFTQAAQVQLSVREKFHVCQSICIMLPYTFVPLRISVIGTKMLNITLLKNQVMTSLIP